MEKPDHTHIWVSKYTEAEHWQECNVCGAEKADSRHAHTMTGNGGSKFMLADVSGKAYKESCTCGKSTGPQVIVMGDPGQYNATSYAPDPTDQYLSNILQITYDEYVANNYPVNSPVVGAKYQWYDYDGDGLGHVFVNGLVYGASMNSIKYIIGSEGDYGKKRTEDEYYILVEYVNNDSTPTRSEFVTYLRNKINSSSHPTDHALYGYDTKYSNVSDAKFNELAQLIRIGDTVITYYHQPQWGCTTGHMIRAGAESISASQACHYGGHHTHYDSNQQKEVGWYGPAGTCDVCGLYFDGLADTYHDWHICNGANEPSVRNVVGGTYNCGGHSVTLNGVHIGTIYCHYKNINGTIQISWTAQGANGYTPTMSRTTYNIPKYDGATVRPYDYPNLVTFSNGTLSKSRYAGMYYVLNDNTVPTAYGYTNATTNTNYWQVINNGTASNPSTQPQVKVTFRDLAQFSNNTMRVRVLDSDKSTVIKQANGNEWVPLSIISGANGTNDSEVLWQGTLNVPTEVDGSKNIYIQAQDSTGHTSEMIPMQISYVDYSGPEITLSLDTNAWSPYKTLTVTVDDIHDVYLGVFKDDMINVSNSTYNNKRTYVFNGDMYETNYVTVYALDSLGNLSYKTIKVSDIDSASPNINKVSISGKTITISADDLNATINEVGSGISHYGYIKNGSEGDITWATTNVITLPSKGTYLIYTKDKAGNISDPYQVEIQN